MCFKNTKTLFWYCYDYLLSVKVNPSPPPVLLGTLDWLFDFIARVRASLALDDEESARE